MLHPNDEDGGREEGTLISVIEECDVEEEEVTNCSLPRDEGAID